MLAAIDEAGIERRWCLGDVVGYGAQPDECAELVSERCELCLVGNHDLAVLGEIGTEVFSAAAAAAVEWTRANSEPTTIEFLKALEARERRARGRRSTTPRRATRSGSTCLAVDQAGECIEEQAARVSLIGHSHVALLFSDGDGPARRGRRRPGGGRQGDRPRRAPLAAQSRAASASRATATRAPPGSSSTPRRGQATYHRVDLRHRPGGGGDPGGRAARAARRSALRGPVMSADSIRGGVSSGTARLAAMPNDAAADTACPRSWRPPPAGVLGCGGSSGPDPSISAQERRGPDAPRSTRSRRTSRSAAAWSPPTRPTTWSPTSTSCPSSVNSDVKNALDNGANNLKVLLDEPRPVPGPGRRRRRDDDQHAHDDHRADDHDATRRPTTTTDPHPDPADDDHPDPDDARPPTAGGVGRDRAGRTMSPRSPKGELISDRYQIDDRLGSAGCRPSTGRPTRSSSAPSR